MVSGASVVVKGERKLNWQYAPVVKLANTRDLGSRAERLAGSIPVRSIQTQNNWELGDVNETGTKCSKYYTE